MNMRKLCVLVAIPFTLGACLQRSLPIPLGSNTRYHGYINEGEKFGVSIGDTRSDARAILEKRNTEYIAVNNCDHHLKRLINCTEELQSDGYYLEETFRHGYFFLEFEGDNITAIIWDLKFLSNVDF